MAVSPFEALLGAVLVTILQSPFHLVLASPLLAIAWLAARLTRASRGSLPRTLLLTGIVAVGVAPAYGFHMSMMPAYLICLSDRAWLGDAVLSMLMTWVALALALALYGWAKRVRAKYHPTTPNC